MQKRSSEQRWAIEDGQKRAQRNLSAAEAEQDAAQQQLVQDRLRAEMQMKVDDAHGIALHPINSNKQYVYFTQYIIPDDRSLIYPFASSNHQ